MKKYLSLAFVALIPAATSAETLSSNWDRIIDTVIIYDAAQLFAVGCQDPAELWVQDGAVADERRDYLDSGDPVDPAVFGRVGEAGCIILEKGSSGRAARDENGEIVIHVDVAEYPDDTYELDKGWYYFRPRAIRSDIETVMNFD